MQGDPLLLKGARPKQANLSELMRRKAQALAGRVVNMCPHGCEDHELDDHGYCRHLIGFTKPGNPKVFEYFAPALEGDPRKLRTVNGADVRPVKKTDQLVRITDCFRVYRDVDAELEEATRPAAKPA